MSGFGIFPDHAPQYGTLDTYQSAAEWLDGYGTVYDWGCGKGFSRRFFSKSQWVGIDGTFNGDANVDLAKLRLHCDSILMRHVLEHNVDCWQELLKNAVQSFRFRMALVTFLPFSDQTHVVKTERYGDTDLPYLSFRKSDLTDLLAPFLVTDRPIQTTHHEHLFLLAK
jgi:hypothetical protein